MSTSEQQMQQLVDQVQMLTAELAAQRLELDAAKNALDQQTQTATAALSVAQAAIAQMGKTETQKKTLNPKLVNPPDPFQGTDADWERYKFGFATWISTVDPTYPDLLRKAELERDEVATVEMTEADEQLSTNLFAILVGQCQAGKIPAMAMLVPERNGLELWRRMHARFEPENKHKPFAWLRALSNPTFPTKETLCERMGRRNCKVRKRVHKTIRRRPETGNFVRSGPKSVSPPDRHELIKPYVLQIDEGIHSAVFEIEKPMET